MHEGLHRKAIRTPNKQLDLGACIHFNKGRSIWKNDKQSNICVTGVQEGQKSVQSFHSQLHMYESPTLYLIQFSCSVVSDSWQPHGLQHARLVCPSPTPGVYSNSCPSSQWCHPTMLSSPSPPALNLSQHQGLFKWVSSSHQVAKVLEFQLQHQSFQRTPRTDLI